MSTTSQQPLKHVDQWDDFIAERYREGKAQADFRNYDEQTNPAVAEFYRLNHANQTLGFVLAKEKEFGPLTRGKKSVWAAADYLNTLVDDSDPDTDLSQIEHLLQTAEATRNDGHPRWFILAGFIHDLGKVLCLYGEPQWAVVGDTFPAGLRLFGPDRLSSILRAKPGQPGPRVPDSLMAFMSLTAACENVHMSWGHDEYIYRAARQYFLPEAAALHAALSLVLRGPPAWRLSPPYVAAR